MPLIPKNTGPYYTTQNPLKQYTAIINQSATDAPTAIVLYNTIGTIVWTRTGPGNYRGTLTGAFPNNKTIAFVGVQVESADIFTDTTDENFIELNSFSGGLGEDDLLINQAIQILVYP